MIFKHKVSFCIGLFFLASLLIACDGKRVYEQNTDIQDYNWNNNSALSFEVNIQDTVALHNMYVNVRNAGYYRFSNLFLFMNTSMPNGNILRDTLEITLATPEGKWLGNGLGDIYDNRFLFRKQFKFPQAGSYKFELIQGMRVNPLPGIMDAGIRIEKE